MRQESATSATVGAWRATFAALCAILVGLGLARFAYTPLIPALIAEGWFTPSQAAYLGAANLAGYFVGALLGRRFAQISSAGASLRAMMLLVAASFLACAFPLPFFWFFFWRFCAGLAGGTLMVLAAPTVLPHVPAARHGLAGGVIFTGVGVGIVVSGTLVPLLLDWGLPQAWSGLAALALVLTLLAWSAWPAEAGSAAPPAVAHTAAAALLTRAKPALIALYIEYGLIAVSLVPHMVFLVDFVARELEHGIAAGAQYWVLFGVGAVVGPVLSGHLADRLGFRRALRLVYLALAGAVGVLSIAAAPFWLAFSSLLVGALVPGITALTLGRIQELVPHDSARRTAAWSIATIAFAVGQAAAAYGFSFLYSLTGTYTILFALGFAALCLAFLLDLAAGIAEARRNEA